MVGVVGVVGEVGAVGVRGPSPSPHAVANVRRSATAVAQFALSQAYLKEVQRILAEVHGVSERQRRWPRRVRIVSVEAVAELWLLPRRRAR